MKKFNFENIQLFFGALGILIVLVFFNPAHAAHKKYDKINCETNFGEKSFTIEDNSIAFHKIERANLRKISSVYEARNQNTHKGFKKTIYLEGNKHLINIQDFKNLNNQDDFLAITNAKGHKMTYPINCTLIQ